MNTFSFISPYTSIFGHAAEPVGEAHFKLTEIVKQGYTYGSYFYILVTTLLIDKASFSRMTKLQMVELQSSLVDL